MTDVQTATINNPIIQRERRSVKSAMLKGLKSRCPKCGHGKLFRKFLKPVDSCSSCNEEIHHHRADDFPPYITLFIVGHTVVTGFMMTDHVLLVPDWVHFLIWAPITIVLSLLILQPIKGAIIGLQWANRMHGFDKGKN